jgi:PPPDE putative peptidase domain
MKKMFKQQFDFFRRWLPCLILFITSSSALAQSRVWISNPTNYQIHYKLLFANSSQNFSIPAGLRNEHTSMEYPVTFLVDLNVNLSGYPQIKRFRLEPQRTYYFQLSGNQLHLLKQPAQGYSQIPIQASVTAKVLVYALGGPQPLYHSSIILYNTADPYINGQEWSFWPHGNVMIGNIGYIAGGRVASGRPSGVGKPIRSFDLTTQHNPQMAAAIFNDVRNRWNQRPYRPLDSNCNHFVNDAMAALGSGLHPAQYQNSWGAQASLTQVQSAFENHYGVSCGHLHGHGQVLNQPGVHHHNQPNQPYDVKKEIIGRVLRRIGL